MPGVMAGLDPAIQVFVFCWLSFVTPEHAQLQRLLFKNWHKS
jgi:hypothetical protein